jgi:hypothetical protein
MSAVPAIDSPGCSADTGGSIWIVVMKTAYELAMERLSKTAPSVKLTDEQKKQIAELESQCAAKIAERELLIQDEIEKAVDKGDDKAIEQLQKQLISDRKSLRATFESKREAVRQGAK